MKSAAYAVGWAMPKHRILIVEDEEDLAALVRQTLERTGEVEARSVGAGDAALRAVSELHHQAVQPRV